MKNLLKKISKKTNQYVFVWRFLLGTKLRELCFTKYRPWHCILKNNPTNQKGNLILGRFLSLHDFILLKQQYQKLTLLVSCIEEYALNASIIKAPTHQQLIAENAQRLHVPMTDFSADINPHQLSSVLKTIHTQLITGSDVYVHCKAGRGRSWLVVICYLMQYENMSLTDAATLVSSQRSYVKPSKTQLDFVKAFNFANQH